MGSKENAIRTQLPGAGYGHGRSDAELPGFIGGTANYTPTFAFLGIGSDHDGLSLIFGMLSNLNRGKESIQVDMQYHSHSGTLLRNLFSGYYMCHLFNLE
jgi:hypothetical protein